MRRFPFQRPGAPRLPRPRYRRALALLAALILGPAACDSGTTEVPPAEGPFLYLVLGERSIDVAGTDAVRQQHAVLLTLSGPDAPVEFRSAVRFAMEDRWGRRFGWLPFDRSGSVRREPAPDTLHPNWLLPADPWAGLGADNLVPGQRYTLALDTEGLLVRGTTTLPGVMDAELTADSAALVWPSVPGAAGYRVLVGGAATLVGDTVFPLTAAQRQAGSLVVDALEPNAWAFLADGAASAGIDRGLGVFGGITRDTVR